MAYTWTDLSAGMTLPAATLNGLGNEVESLSAIVKSPVMASISRSTTQTITTSTHTQIDYDTVDFESQPGMTNLTSNYITIPVTGVWLVSFTNAWGLNASAAGVRISTVRQSPTGGTPSSFTDTPFYASMNTNTVAAIGLSGTAFARLTAGTTIDSTMWQNQGVNQTTYVDLKLRLAAYLLNATS